jgi:hypothetical protein
MWCTGVLFRQRSPVMSGRSGLRATLAAALAAGAAMGATATETERALQVGVTIPGDAAPAIVLRSPDDGGTYASPLPIDIGFEPGHGAAIDLDTLKITVVTHTAIGDFTFDITDAIGPYVSAGGIHAPAAKIPTGEHTVTISVADTLRRQAEQQLTITVRGERGRAD